jgi:hypothetical protein
VVTPLERLIAERAAALAQSGAAAVVLRGSFARGGAHEYSDVDLTPVAQEPNQGPPHLVEQHGDRMFVINWQTAEQIRASYRDPAQLDAAVPAWRSATALYDPNGVAADLIEEAQRWSWHTVEEAVDAYVADEFASLAEEIYKVIAGILHDQRRMAAVNRAVLALRLAHLVALRRGLLWETENDLWDLVAGELGEGWAADQDAALGLADAPTAEQSRSALTLYARAAREIAPILDDRQRAVVRGALAAVERAASSATHDD